MSLIKGSCKANLEFLQWFKKYFETNYARQHNDPVAARAASTSHEHDQLVSESIFMLKLFLALAGGPFLKKLFSKLSDCNRTALNFHHKNVLKVSSAKYYHCFRLL